MFKVPIHWTSRLILKRIRIIVIVSATLWFYITMVEIFSAYLNNSELLSETASPFTVSGSRIVAHALLFPMLLAFYIIAMYAYHAIKRATPAVLAQGALAFAFASQVRMFTLFGIYITNSSSRLPAQHHVSFINAIYVPIMPWLITTISYLLTYVAGLFIILGIDARLELEEQRSTVADLNLKWLHARLSALRGQLNPHFLFNSLHTVSALVLSNPKRADKFLADLSEILRITLREGERDYASVREEMDYVARYLAIEEIRFEDRLKVNVNVSRSVLDAKVPSLMLQPIIENAIKYGRPSDGERNVITIDVNGDVDTIQFVVSNAYSHKISDSKKRETAGMGLRITRERLATVYGNRFVMTAGVAHNDQWRTCIKIPHESIVRHSSENSGESVD